MSTPVWPATMSGGGARRQAPARDAVSAVRAVGTVQASDTVERGVWSA